MPDSIKKIKAEREHCKELSASAKKRAGSCTVRKTCIKFRHADRAAAESKPGLES